MLSMVEGGVYGWLLCFTIMSQLFCFGLSHPHSVASVQTLLGQGWETVGWGSGHHLQGTHMGYFYVE